MAVRSDTIFALSSGSLPSGVAVVRLSGPASFDAGVALAGSLPPPRVATLKSIRTRDDRIIDRGLVLVFPAPASFTGEDCLELQLHGGRAVVSALFSELEHLGLRPAEAGEFTHRAFENGKLDLVEVEGLGDLISAETEMQRRLAVEHLQGGLSIVYQAWAERLVRARALIEAELDFADEDDIPGSVSDQVWSDVSGLRAEIDRQVDATSSAGFVRDGFRVVIAGAPNAGKSSLLNALAKRDVAIVTDIAGTTRDLLEVDLDLGGFLVRLTDTAGLRDTGDIVEREGVRRAGLAIERADLVLLLEEIDSDSKPFLAGFNDERNYLKVGTKLDLHPQSSRDYDCVISVETGAGLQDLVVLVNEKIQQKWAAISALGPGRARHVQHLKQASILLAEALLGADLDLRAESLRLAGESLGRITGRIDAEDLLDVIFSEFCIGK